jgi:hypothetical protein
MMEHQPSQGGVVGWGVGHGFKPTSMHGLKWQLVNAHNLWSAVLLHIPPQKQSKNKTKKLHDSVLRCRGWMRIIGGGGVFNFSLRLAQNWVQPKSPPHDKMNRGASLDPSNKSLRTNVNKKEIDKP